MNEAKTPRVERFFFAFCLLSPEHNGNPTSARVTNLRLFSPVNEEWDLNSVLLMILMSIAALQCLLILLTFKLQKKMIVIMFKKNNVQV